MDAEFAFALVLPNNNGLFQGIYLNFGFEIPGWSVRGAICVSVSPI
jgi:hypothetical protein